MIVSEQRDVLLDPINRKVFMKIIRAGCAKPRSLPRMGSTATNSLNLSEERNSAMHG
jgi:hypothetical protein